MRSSPALDPARARGHGGKRPRDVPFGVKADCATARVVLGLAHDAKHAFDLKWRPSPPRPLTAPARDERKSRESSSARARGRSGTRRGGACRRPRLLSRVSRVKKQKRRPALDRTVADDHRVVKCVPSWRRRRSYVVHDGGRPAVRRLTPSPRAEKPHRAGRAGGVPCQAGAAFFGRRFFFHEKKKKRGKTAPRALRSP